MAFNQVTWLYRFLFLLVFSVALMIVDHRSNLLAPLRTVASVINLPFHGLIAMPTAIGQWLGSYYPDDTLHHQYTTLRAENLRLQAHLQKFDALQVENQRLADLLSLSREFGERALLSEIVEIGLYPFTHRLALNHGVESGVYVGQPVVTKDGVLGQISGLGIRRSVVTLITDRSHALPVLVQRNGLRTIVRGSGGANRVEAPFLSTQADIRVGDILVTSGLGGGFPAGYKVAQVREVVVDANKAFMSVDAVTFANVDYARDALLLWVERQSPTSDSDENGDEGAASQ